MNYNEINSFNESFLSSEEKRRIKITTSCHDCDVIPKVPGAGQVFKGSTGSYQLMHNGVKIVENCYYGRWMTELISLLKGHHVPQEERAFYEVLNHVHAGSVMIEVGSYWSYYSLWFQKQTANARNYMIEPDPNNLAAGRQNFELNDVKGIFLNAAIGKESRAGITFQCESDHVVRSIPIISIDDFVVQQGIDRVEILLCDAQGFELEMLGGSVNCLRNGLIRFMVISTHHHSISQDPLTHQKCLNFPRKYNAHILVEHTIAELFSGDGLIVVSFNSADAILPKIEISRNSAANNLFREMEYDLDDAWARNKQLQAELNSLYQSRSYRITKPFRNTADMIRRLLKRS